MQLEMSMPIDILASLFVFNVFLDEPILLELHPVIFDAGRYPPLIDVIIEYLVCPSEIDKTVNILKG